MENNKLRKVALAIFALTLTSATVFAQANRNGNQYYRNQNATCLNYISDLSDKQQTQIVEMEKQHQEEMAKLRTNRRSTSNAIEKSEIRTEMLKKVEAHRKSVKKVLNAEQILQYDQLHTQGNLAQNRNYGNRRGYGNFQGGRGNCGKGFGYRDFQRGNGRGNRQNACFGYRNNGRGSYRFNAIN